MERDDARRRGLSDLAARLLERVDALAGDLTKLIRTEVDFYRSRSVVSDTELHANLRNNLVQAIGSLSGGAADAAAVAVETGRLRCRAGVPLPALMDAYRVGSAFLWRNIVEEAAASRLISTADLVDVASEVWLVQERFTSTMAGAYRDEQTLQVLVQEEERSALVAALLEGRITETSTLWEVADILRLSVQGDYVVVTAALARPGRQALPNVEVALRVMGVSSAWRLTPDQQIGIVQLRDAAQQHQLLVTLRRLASGPVGLSPQFAELGDVADAVRLARIAMAGSLPGRSLIVAFDDEPLAVTATAAPRVSRRVAGRVLAGLAQLPAPERALILATFEAWLDNGGSVTATASSLYCHYNTVRHRLRKLERLTGRSLRVPRELTELCLALEMQRRLPAATTSPADAQDTSLDTSLHGTP